MSNKKKSEEKPQIRVCPKCLSPTKEKVKFCQTCGVELIDKCPSCEGPFTGTNPRKKIKFCPDCGADIEKVLSLEALKRIKIISPKRKTEPNKD